MDMKYSFAQKHLPFYDASDEEHKVPEQSANKQEHNTNEQVQLREEKSEPDPLSRVTPPVPSKKPTFPIKKSPSGSGSQGLFAGLRKKLVDVVDGATSSKSASSAKIVEAKESPKANPINDNAFDQVVRTPMLQDVRATRAKAPGRRPPSVVIKDGEPGITNGFSDHSLDVVSENSSTSDQSEETAKLRDPEKPKHHVPWLEEMKLNQAKRSSTSPKQEQNKLKDKSSSPESEEKEKFPVEREKAFAEREKPEQGKDDIKTGASTVESNKPSLQTKPKISPSEIETVASAVVRKMAPAPGGSVLARPQTIHNIPEKPTTTHLATKLTPSPKVSPPPKPVITDVKAGGDHVKTATSDHRKSDGKVPNDQSKTETSNIIADLLERVQKLEKQNAEQEAAIEQLKAKLQLETDMRQMLQAELERISDCVLHV